MLARGTRPALMLVIVLITLCDVHPSYGAQNTVSAFLDAFDLPQGTKIDDSIAGLEYRPSITDRSEGPPEPVPALECIRVAPHTYTLVDKTKAQCPRGYGRG